MTKDSNLASKPGISIVELRAPRTMLQNPPAHLNGWKGQETVQVQKT